MIWQLELEGKEGQGTGNASPPLRLHAANPEGESSIALLLGVLNFAE